MQWVRCVGYAPMKIVRSRRTGYRAVRGIEPSTVVSRIASPRDFEYHLRLRPYLGRAGIRPAQPQEFDYWRQEGNPCRLRHSGAVPPGLSCIRPVRTYTGRKGASSRQLELGCVEARSEHAGGIRNTHLVLVGCGPWTCAAVGTAPRRSRRHHTHSSLLVGPVALLCLCGCISTTYISTSALPHTYTGATRTRYRFRSHGDLEWSVTPSCIRQIHSPTAPHRERNLDQGIGRGEPQEIATDMS